MNQEHIFKVHSVEITNKIADLILYNLHGHEKKINGVFLRVQSYCIQGNKKGNFKPYLIKTNKTNQGGTSRYLHYLTGFTFYSYKDKLLQTSREFAP